MLCELRLGLHRLQPATRQLGYVAVSRVENAHAIDNGFQAEGEQDYLTSKSAGKSHASAGKGFHTMQ